jgi:hypothetical protein
VELLFVQQIEIYEYTNRIFSVDVEHYYSHTTFILTFPPLRVPPAAAASVAASATWPLSAPPPPPAAVSVATVSVAVAAVSATATIAVSADIAAAFWLIVVCPRCCLCFRLPPPFFPAPAVAHRCCLPAPLPMLPPPPPPPLFLLPSLPPPPPPPAAVSVAAVSVAAVSVAAVSAAATIAVSADIAAAFWSIVVCPRLPLFRSPSPP